MALSLDQVLNALEEDNFDIDDAGISSDEEEDLDRCLESSGNDSRQVFICFFANRCSHVMVEGFEFAFDAIVTFDSN